MRTKKLKHMTFRMPEPLRERLEDLAGQNQMSKSHVLRAVVAALTNEQCGALIEAARKQGKY